MNWKQAAATLCLALLLSSPSPGSEPVIQLTGSKGKSAVEVAGLSASLLKGLESLPAGDEKWAKVLAVFVERPGTGREGQPAMLGSYSLSGGALRFEPRFPLAPGVRYRVLFSPESIPGAAGPPREKVVVLERPKREPSTVVARVYPTADRLPENLLKFYFHFSAPMSQGDCYRHIRLLDEKGKPIDLPFLELDQELWDRSGTRLTVFIDPGRIKRGLKPREDAGPVLEEGKRYTLVVAKTWKDAQGDPLKEAFRKTFSVSAPTEKQPDPKAWKIQPPPAGSREPLRVLFTGGMDHAMLQHQLWVEMAGKRLAGKVEVTEKETVWHFTPESPWRAGPHDLTADTRLEDQAGNSIARPFEVDVLRPVEREVKKETVRVGFVVR